MLPISISEHPPSLIAGLTATGVSRMLDAHVEPLTRLLEALRTVLEPEPDDQQQEIDDLQARTEDLETVIDEAQGYCQTAVDAAQDLRDAIDALNDEDGTKEPLCDGINAVLVALDGVER